MGIETLLWQLYETEADEPPELLSLLSDSLKNSSSDINALDWEGLSPLHRAVDRRLPELTRLLLEHGANPTRPDSEGRVPLAYLIDDRPESTTVVDIATMLLGHGADPNSIYYQQRPVHYQAVFRSYRDLANLLEQRGATVTLNAALLLHRLDRVREILGTDSAALSHAPDPDMIASDAMSSAYWVQYNLADDVEILRLLFDAGLSPHSTATWEPLLVQARELRFESSIISLLIERGADVNARGYVVPGSTEKGRTPLDIAIRRGDTVTATLLRTAGGKTSSEVDG